MYIRHNNFHTEEACFKYLTDNFTVLEQYKKDKTHYIESRKKRVRILRLRQRVVSDFIMMDMI